MTPVKNADSETVISFPVRRLMKICILYSIQASRYVRVFTLFLTLLVAGSWLLLLVAGGVV